MQTSGKTRPASDTHARLSRRARVPLVLVLLGAWIAFGSGSGCGEPATEQAVEPSGPPNIVLITLDTTRADHLPTYGYFRHTAPILDELAKDSLVFDRLIVPMATTLPTHISILTGTYPLEHGVLANATQGGERFVPSSQLRSFAVLSQDSGYHTAGFVSAAPLKKGSGAEIGFAVFDQPQDKHRNAEETTDAALSWLANRSAPFFLWVHYYDAHYPFTPPPDYAGMYETDDQLRAFLEERKVSPTAVRPLVGRLDIAEEVINAYDAEIRYADTHMGRVLAALRSRPDWDNTAVVVMGDHGEGLCQHGLSAHGATWNEQIHAPLVMRVPEQPPRRIGVTLSAIDVFPTLLGMLDAPQGGVLAQQATGRDVLAGDYQARAILSQDTGRTRTEGVPYRYTLVEDRWKIFRIDRWEGGVDWELYDLQNDPYELEDVLAANPEVADRMRADLDAEVARQKQRGLALRGGAEPETREVDPELRKQLEALGYLPGEGEEAHP